MLLKRLVQEILKKWRFVHDYEVSILRINTNIIILNIKLLITYNENKIKTFHFCS